MRGRHVVLRGRAIARDLMNSPHEGRACVYYNYVVETWSRSTASWLIIEQDEAITEFYLQDESGRAVVAPHQARVEVVPAAMRVAKRDDGSRVREAVIRPGDIVEIHGVLDEAEDLLDEARGYREDMTRLVVRAVDGGELRIKLVDA